MLSFILWFAIGTLIMYASFLYAGWFKKTHKRLVAAMTYGIVLGPFAIIIAGMIYSFKD